MEQSLFACPVCGAPLERQEKCYVCPARHCFDIARRGYVNLLTGHIPANRHGDNREMIEARTAFLAAGYYDMLIERVTEMARAALPCGGRILDAGCGECTYTAAVARTFHNTRVPCEVIGIDISREALVSGARKCPYLHLAVASAYHLPVPSESVDLLLSLFSPFAEEEFARVLKPGGYLLMAVPARRHLFGLKHVLYATPYENEVQDAALSLFSLEERVTLEKTVTVDSADVWNLFTMTPYFYRTSPADKEKLRTHGPLETEISFEVFLYKKK